MFKVIITTELLYSIEKDTLYEELIKSGRRVGNSTRQLNQAIEDLFEGFTLVVKDHYKAGECRTANLLLTNNIIARLKIEHDVNNIEVDYSGKYPKISIINE
jgi:hypothetical protein